MGDISYTEAQRLTIALAELASALGLQLTRNDAINPDWRLVDRMTEHVRQLERPVSALPRHLRPALPMAKLLRDVRAGFDLRVDDEDPGAVAACSALDEIERRLTELTIENLGLKGSNEARDAVRAGAKRSCFCPGVAAVGHLPGCPRRDG